MRHFSASFDLLLNSSRSTLNTFHKQFGEYTIDWMHRLAKMGLTIDEIVDVTGVPYESVQYWYDLNGYSD